MTHNDTVNRLVTIPTGPNDTQSPTPLPDVTEDTVARIGGTLDRVGMSGIEVGLRIRSPDDQLVLTPGKATAQISLDDPDAKGIHMSRLFLSLQEALDEEEFGLRLVERLLRAFVESQAGISSSSYLEFSFEYLTKRSSLLSDHATWRSYPVRTTSELREGRVRHHLHVDVAYSSTCPCSAALTRQVLQQQFLEDFADHRWLTVSEAMRWLGSHGTAATPHSQRSHAEVTVALDESCRMFPFIQLVDALESALVTPVQAVVKRQDEQEFARRNGENLMFCEDAARRIRAALERFPALVDYRIRASHLESLHPHDAVAIAVKGVPGGLQA
jgi:GTP cyclohydrolase I